MGQIPHSMERISSVSHILHNVWWHGIAVMLLGAWLILTWVTVFGGHVSLVW